MSSSPASECRAYLRFLRNQAGSPRLTLSPPVGARMSTRSPWRMANLPWALGWTVTTAAGIDVSRQWAVFGAFGCLTLAFLQSMIIGAFVPAKAVTS